eukprot:2462719-Alexandrium_andersonii.AAC.1
MDDLARTFHASLGGSDALVLEMRKQRHVFIFEPAGAVKAKANMKHLEALKTVVGDPPKLKTFQDY